MVDRLGSSIFASLFCAAYPAGWAAVDAHAAAATDTSHHGAQVDELVVLVVDIQGARIWHSEAWSAVDEELEK